MQRFHKYTFQPILCVLLVALEAVTSSETPVRLDDLLLWNARQSLQIVNVLHKHPYMELKCFTSNRLSDHTWV